MKPTTTGPCERLLAATPPPLRDTVRLLLGDPLAGGRGLRAWAARIEIDPRPLPDSLPAVLVEVYLRDADAEPLHDCGGCGLPVPVRVGHRTGHEPTCERVYFARCPHCGGDTGPFAYWSRPRPVIAALDN